MSVSTVWGCGHWHSRGHYVTWWQRQDQCGLGSAGVTPSHILLCPLRHLSVMKALLSWVASTSIRWSELKETHKSSSCGLGPPRHSLGPENAPVLGWMDVARQGWPLTSETERNCGLVSFISVKAAMGSGGSIEMLSANAGAIGGHEVARNGSGWPGQLQDGCVAGEGL